MTRGCVETRAELTALADGALAHAEAGALRAHLATCAECSAELTGLESAVALSRNALADLPELRPGFETRLRAHLDELSVPALPWYRRLFRPVLITAAAAASVLLLARSVGGPQSVLVPLGIQSPPTKVAEKPVLFTDYEIIEHLDELENFETVIQTPLEPEVTGVENGAG